MTCGRCPLNAGSSRHPSIFWISAYSSAVSPTVRGSVTASGASLNVMSTEVVAPAFTHDLSQCPSQGSVLGSATVSVSPLSVSPSSKCRIPSVPVRSPRLM